uniref:Translation elongation factor EF1B beta/delta subunit guanine nucleotide exchange domain-containing protein n=1 Tax=Macaca nemestrina TaxID=9545 RepID=A0A2K6C434_MACNE
MATNFLVHEKIWFDKFKHDVAERRFYEQMNGPVCASSNWTGWCGRPPSWCPWATVSGSCRFSVWWRTRWRQTWGRRRSPSLKSVCRVSTLLTKSE